MSNHVCSDERIVNLCKELFTFLRSDNNEEVIHSKKVTKLIRGSTKVTEITIGFIRIRMVWQPFTKEGNIEKGSDEGANLFIYLPFKEPGSNEDSIEIKGYYSERGNQIRVTAIVEDTMKPSLRGPARIVQSMKIATTNPI